MRILVRGGGDIASGVIVRLHRAGWKVLVTELLQPLAVRRTVSFAQAVYSGQIVIEDITATRVNEIGEVEKAFTKNHVPVMIDPHAIIREVFNPDIIIDGRMRKISGETLIHVVPLIIGLGPGFTAGVDCDAVVETKRGFHLGRVLWQGSAQPDTGIPETMAGHTNDRILRAPIDGIMQSMAEIGSWCKKGDAVAMVNSLEVKAPFDGLIRGLLHDGVSVHREMKIGDLDPRNDPALCRMISDKALAVGGGALEAILTWISQVNKEK